MNIKFLPLSVAIALAGATAVHAAPQSGSMAFSVSVQALGGPVAADFEATNWTVVPSSLTLSASATSNDPAGLPNDVFVNGGATWAADGNSGVVDLTWGWKTVDLTSIATNGGADWKYEFRADATGTFEMNYDILGVGPQLFGLNGVLLTSNFDSATGVPVTNAFDPTTSGLFVGGVTAGQDYWIKLDNNGNVGSEGGYKADSKGVGHFVWSITPGVPGVPDASSTLLLIGVALAGLIWVRRRLQA